MIKYYKDANLQLYDNTCQKFPPLKGNIFANLGVGTTE